MGVVNEEETNPAMLAAKEDWAALIQLVISCQGALDLDQREPHGDSAMQYSALLYAAYYDKPELFSWLVQRGGDPRLLDTNKKSALHIATKYGSASIVRLLLLEGVDPTQKDCWGRVARDLLTDRRSVIKETSTDSLKEVERVYDHWPAVKQALASGGVGGISALSKVEATTAALKAEALEFYGVLTKPVGAVPEAVGLTPIPVPEDVQVFIIYTHIHTNPLYTLLDESLFAPRFCISGCRYYVGID
jgi:hypothetical protein